jgi:hypothetical protein
MEMFDIILRVALTLIITFGVFCLIYPLPIYGYCCKTSTPYLKFAKNYYGHVYRVLKRKILHIEKKEETK